METVAEIWRAIPGKIHYEASNLGRIRSLDQLIVKSGRDGVTRRMRWKGRVLKSSKIRGYLTVNLGDANERRGVHQWVALTWIGPVPEKAVVNHINGIKTDNRVENLEYVSQAENVAHAFRTGLIPVPVAQKKKLTAAEILEARRLFQTGQATITQLAEKYRRTRQNMRYIVHGRSFKNVTGA